MKILELICGLEEAYDRFGDIDVNIVYKLSNHTGNIAIGRMSVEEIIIESEEFIIKCEN